MVAVFKYAKYGMHLDCLRKIDPRQFLRAEYYCGLGADIARVVTVRARIFSFRWNGKTALLIVR